MRTTLYVVVLALLGLMIARTGGGNELPKPGDKPKVVREQVQGQWRFQGEKLLRISGRVKVLDAHTLRFEDAKKLGRAEAFVEEANLAAEMLRNGWAMAHHSGTAAWEVIARDNKRGLWRGKFVFPEKWRKGDRLPQEK